MSAKVRVALIFAWVAVLLIGSSSSLNAALYSQNFDLNDTANWTVNKSVPAAPAGDTLADFFFDYSTIGIPSAPGSGGSTRGLKMYANHSGGVFSGLSVSPTGQSFSGNYYLRFNAWLNYNGVIPPTAGGIGTGGTNAAGGNGTTQAGSWGIMTSGTVPQWAGGTTDSMMFAATVDGGSTQDYRVYPKGALAAPSTGYYAAGTNAGPTPPDSRNDTDPYYFTFGSKTAPAAQQALFPSGQQSGTTRSGSAGFAWRDIEIKKGGNIVTWFMDGKLIATVDTTTLGSFGGGNIFLGHFDTNGTSSTDPNDTALLFTLIDNVVVDVPEGNTVVFGTLLCGVIGLMTCTRRFAASKRQELDNQE